MSIQTNGSQQGSPQIRLGRKVLQEMGVEQLAIAKLDVPKEARIGDLVEVFGPLKNGDVIVRRGTDELRQGAKVKAQAAKPS